MSAITTHRDARSRIIDAIEVSGVIPNAEAAYDIDAILDETYEFEMPHGYRQVVSPELFWASVAAHEKAPA